MSDGNGQLTRADDDGEVRDPAWASQPQPEDDLFYGPYGLRAGWGIALYLVAASVFVVLVMACLSLAQGVAQRPSQRAANGAVASASTTDATPRQDEKPGSVAVNDGVLLLAISAGAFLMARLERRSVGVYGLGPQHVHDVLPGALAGLLLLSALVAALHALRLLVVDGANLHTLQAVRSGAAWLLTFALVGLFEEYLFRGYLQYTLTRGLLGLARHISPHSSRALAFSLSAVLLSLLFCFVHRGNGGETPTGLAAVFVAGLVFSYALWRTGSLSTLR